MKFSILKIIFLNLLILSSLFSTTFEDDLKAIDGKNFNEKENIVTQLANNYIEDDRLTLLLSKMLDGDLFIKNDDKDVVVLVKKEENSLYTKSLISGNDLENGIKKLLSEEMKKLPAEQQPSDAELEKLVNEESKKITIPWFVYFLKLNPDVYWSTLKIPVLAMNGTLDMQVISKENLNGIKSSLEKAKNNQFEIAEFPNLNHLFQEAKTGDVDEYAQLEQTIAPAVLEKMSSWILKR